MKTIKLSIIYSLTLANFSLMAQIYEDPASGNVGIGTTTFDNPQNWNKILQLNGPLHAKFLVTESSGVKIGIYSHMGYNGKIGTESNHDLTFTAGYWNDVMTLTTAKNVGIGTLNPSHKLTVDGNIKLNGQSKGLLVEYATLSETVNGASTILGNNVIAGIGNNTIKRFYSPNDPGSYVSLNYYDGITFHTGVKSALNTEVSSFDNEVMRITQSGNIGIGTSIPKEKLAVNGNVSVNGKIGAKEVKVEAKDWPDYVFDKDYKIISLAETERFIKVNKHLPEMPSVKEVEKNGVELGEMNKLLLKKVEELTLHLIEKEKDILLEKTINEAQENRILLLEKNYKRLEKILKQNLK